MGFAGRVRIRRGNVNYRGRADAPAAHGLAGPAGRPCPAARPGRQPQFGRRFSMKAWTPSSAEGSIMLQAMVLPASW